MEATYTIGRLAKEVGVNIQTLRYYERRKLLVPKTRKVSGYRVYDEYSLKRLRFIKRAQELGFSLKEIKELLNLRVDTRARCGDIQDKAKEKLKDVDTKIRHLEAIQDVLKKLIRTCHREQTTEQCPILSSLEDER